MNGFGAGAAAVLRSGGETLEKIDMSLDDIIKLNKKEERKQYSPRMKRGVQQNGARQFRMRRTKWGLQEYTGFGKNRLGRRKRVAGKRRPYSVKTGLAARKALGSHKGISPLNRPPLSEKSYSPRAEDFRNSVIAPLCGDNECHPSCGYVLLILLLISVDKVWAVTNKNWDLGVEQTNVQSPSSRLGNKLYQQKDMRQATFLFRRGLKMGCLGATLLKGIKIMVSSIRTVRWRTSTTKGGILTVSIDNPGAVPSPISFKPRLTSTPMPPFLMKRDQSEEKKIPKGVPLQFDINSVGKQTNMTLNERFGILKEQRTALSQNKGSRFVTVG
ncbi:hypothetical protein lerEdw1_005084 [Lerista edwardsae]|nr:hypothetical protein lerEdw1_005084 [Lerista edwardsae]